MILNAIVDTENLFFQLLAAFIVSFIAVMAVIGSHEYLPINLGTPGLVGLALSYAAPIVSLLGSFLTSFTETEKEMVSVERILQVTKFIYIHKSFITQIEISFLLHIL